VFAVRVCVCCNVFAVRVCVCCNVFAVRVCVCCNVLQCQGTNVLECPFRLQEFESV